jgi:hypothetical protein
MAIRVGQSPLSRTPLLVLILALGGCATVFQGPRRRVRIFTEPEGATATVDGQSVTTPGVLVLRGWARSAEIRIEKEGYVPQTFALSRGTSNATWWSFVGIAGGAASPVAGFGLDYATAAAYRPEPALVVVKLEPATVAVASTNEKETP